MSNYIEEQFRASGVAQVIVVLKSPADSVSTANDLGKHFRLADTAPQIALANALGFRKGGGGQAKVTPATAMRVYEHLGLMLGTVDKDGLAALRAETNQVSLFTRRLLCCRTVP